MNLYEEMEERNEVVISMFRQAESDMDGLPDKGAFAFIIGATLEDALAVEGDIDGDGRQATATIYGVRNGEHVPVQVMELLDGKIMISLPLD